MSGGKWYQVEQGDWLEKIASKTGSTSEAIWSHPENLQLSHKRKPNLLFPGDRLFIPEIAMRVESVTTEQVHSFRVRRKSFTLKIVLRDSSGRPLQCEDCRLRLGDLDIQLRTDDSGLLQQEGLDPAAAHQGWVEFISSSVRIPIAVGNLNPGLTSESSDLEYYDDGLSGIQMRLANLGFYAGPVDGARRPEFTAAVIDFQSTVMNRAVSDITGALDDETRARILKEHDGDT